MKNGENFQLLYTLAGKLNAAGKAFTRYNTVCSTSVSPRSSGGGLASRLHVASVPPAHMEPR